MTATAAATPIREALAGATAAIAAAGVDTARLDAELLLCEATGTDRARIAADPDAGLEPPAGRAFAAMVRRRLRREPLAYITGRKAFREIELAVDRRALIPRPETELLVEVALELRPRMLLDVGTGSGAVALAVASELPACRVAACDTSTAALKLAEENAARLGLAERVAFGLGTLPAEPHFDLLVANLPYVRDGEWEGLAPEIREWEPREALLAGPDGLEAIRALLDSEPRTSAIALEIGAGQGAEVAGLVKKAGFSEVEIRPDLAGLDRVVIGR